MCALKTFNLDGDVYSEFSKHCKENGISMSKKVENFIREELGRIKNPGRRINKKSTSGHERAFSDTDANVDNHHMSKYC